MSEAQINDDGKIHSKRMSDSDFLSEQASEAKVAFQNAVHDAKAALGGAVDPREVTRAHPFIALGTAAIAGLVASLIAVPSKEQQALRRIEKLQRALHPDPPTVVTDSNGESHQPVPSMFSTIIKEIIAVLRPILVAAITAGISSAQSPTPAAQPGKDSPSDPSNGEAKP